MKIAPVADLLGPHRRVMGRTVDKGRHRLLPIPCKMCMVVQPVWRWVDTQRAALSSGSTMTLLAAK
jgi:hypothetical protein